jgi:hypothetical protein
MAAKAPAQKKLSTSNTKQEMLSAYQDLLKELEAQREAETRPEEKIEQRANLEAVKVAEELSTEGVVKQVGELRGNLGRLLSQISGQLEEQMDRYAQISRAIGFKEKELAEIYEIQKSAFSLAALIGAQQQKREQFDQEMTEQKAQLEIEIESARNQWIAEKKQYEAELKERDAAEAKRRKREEDEYRYAFTREQQLARDKFADEQGRVEREFTIRKEQMERELAERERAVAAREQAIEEQAARIAAFPAEREEAVKQAVAETTGRLAAEHASREELLKRDLAGEKNVMKGRIESLEQTVKEQAAQLAKLSQQSERAYGQMQDIAVKAIEGSSGAKSLAGLQQILGEQVRKAAGEK